MSREIDERVVQMKFEKGQFEKDIQTSIHNLDELKKGLNFKDASKGFEELDRAARNTDISALGKAIDQVHMKFGLLEVFALRVMTRISDAAINAGEKLVKSLTIDQVTPGWDKYAQKTSSVQTIMAATAAQFSDTATQMEVVNEQLNKLNWFTDETSYNFVDMVNNIGKFTSNNIALDQSVTAMQGIANWAAISGANAQEASRAMYNLAQALATGTVKLIDWKSIENANMATTEFKQTVIDIATEMGTLKKVGEDLWTTLDGKTQVSVSNFNEGLSKGWFTNDVLMKGLNKYGAASEKLNEIYERLGSNVTTSRIVSSVEDYINALSNARVEAQKLKLDVEETNKKVAEAGEQVAKEVADSWGVSLEEATEMLAQFDNETMQFGLKAFKAAQEAKTFQEAIDSVKDAVSTGWMKTFETLFGPYTEAKELWTNLANTMYDVFATGGDIRNEMLEEWADQGGRKYFTDTIYASLAAILSIMAPIKAAWEAVFGSMTAERLLDITKRLHTFVLSLIQTEESAQKIARVFRGIFSVLDILKITLARIIKGGLGVFRRVLGELNIDAGEFAAKVGDILYSIRNWVKENDLIQGSFERIGDAIIFIIRQVKGFIASVKEFGPVQTILSNIRNIFTDDFQGAGGILIAIGNTLNWLWSQIKAFKMPKSLNDIFSFFNNFWNAIKTNFAEIGLDLTWIEALFYDLSGMVANAMGIAANAVTTGVDTMGKGFEYLEKLISKVDWSGVILAAFGIATLAVLWKFATALNNIAFAFKNVTGVGAAAQGALKSIKGYFDALKNSVKNNSTIKLILSITALAAAMIGLSVAFFKFANLKWEQVFKGSMAILAVGGAIAALALAFAVLNKLGFDAKNITVFLATLSAAVLMLTMSLQMIPTNRTLGTRVLGLFATIMALVTGLVVLSKSTKGAMTQINGVIKLAGGILLLVLAMKLIGAQDPVSLLAGAAVISVLTVALGSMIALITKANNLNNKVGADSKITGSGTKGIKIFTGAIGIAVGVMMLITAIKKLGSMDPAVAVRGIVLTIPVMVMLAALFIAANKAGQYAASAGRMILELSVGLAILIPVIKGFAGLSTGVIVKGGLTIAAIMTFIIQPLILASKDSSKYAAKVGMMVLEIAGALAIIQLVVKTLGKLDIPSLAKGTAAVAALILALSITVKALNGLGVANENNVKAMTKLIVIVGIMSTLVLLLSLINPTGGMIAAVGLSALFISLGVMFKLINNLAISDNKNITKLLGNLTALAIIVGVLGAITDWKGALAVAGGMSAIMLALASMTQILKNSATSTTLKEKLSTLSWFAKQMAFVIGELAVVAVIFNKLGGNANDILIITTAMSELVIAMGIMGKLLGKMSVVNSRQIDALVTFVGQITVIIGVVAAVLALVNQGDKPVDLTGLLTFVSAMGELMVSMGISMRLMSGTTFDKSSTEKIIALGVMVTTIGTVFGIIATVMSTSGAKITDMIGFAAAISILVIAMGISAKIMSKSKDGFRLGIGTATSMSLFILAIGATLALFSGMENPEKALIYALAMTPVLLAVAGAAAILSTIPKGSFMGGVEGIGIGLIFIAGLTLLVAAIGGIANWLGGTGALDTGIEIMYKVGEAMGSFVGGIIGGVGKSITSTFPAICDNISEATQNLMPFFECLKDIPGGAVGFMGTLIGVVAAMTGATFLSGLQQLPIIGELMKTGKTTIKNDMTKFGEAIAAFSDEVKNIDGANVKNAADALVALAGLEKDMGGIKAVFNSLIDKIFGSDNLEEFGKRLRKLGQCVSEFAGEVTGIPAETIDGAVTITKTLMTLEQGLPRKDGLLQQFLGQDDFGQFGERLGVLGTALVTFGEKGAQVNAAGVETAKSAAEKLVELESTLEPVGGLTGIIFGKKALNGFGERVSSFGQALVDFSDVIIAGNLTETPFINAKLFSKDLLDIEQQINPSGGVKGFWFGDSGLGSFADNLKDFGKGLVSFSDSLDGVDFTRLYNAAGYIRDLLGLQDLDTTKKDALNAAKDILKTIHDAISSDYAVMKNYGTSEMMWLAEGIKNGSNKYATTVATAATTLAEQFVEAFEAALGIASPSVVMINEGIWVVKGLAEGITNETSAEEAAQKKAQNLVAAFDSELNKLTSKEKTSSLEFELWKLTEGSGASEIEIAQKQLEIENEKLADLAKMVSARKVAMENIAKIAGEDSAEYQSAYQTYLQAQIDMLNQQKNIEETYYSSTSTMLTDPREQATAFANFMKDNAQAYEFLGKSQEELENAAYQAVYGLDSEAVARKRQYEQIMSEYSQSFEYLGKTKEELDAFAKQQSGWEGMSVNAANAMSETAQIIKDNIEYYSLDLETTLDMAMAEIITNSTKSGSKSSAAAAKAGGNLGKNLTKELEKAFDKDDEDGFDFLGLFQMDKWDEIFTDTGIIDWFGTKASGLSSLFSSEFITNLGEQAKPIADGLYEMVQNGIDMSGIQDLVNTFGKDATLGVANGLKDEETKKELIDAINEAIVDTTKDTITGEKGLDINSPSKVTQGYGAAVDEGFANGILENMSVVENAVKDLVTTMKSALNEMPDIGTETMQGYVKGLSDVAAANEISTIAINNAANAKAPFIDIISDLEQIGISAINGFSEGILQEGPKAIEAAEDIANQVAVTIANALKVKSPSRVTMEIGRFVGIGLANGISQTTGDVSKAVEDMSNNTIDSLSYAAEAIDSIINSDENFKPVITPVLDMDQLKKQASGISSILNTDRRINIDSARLRVDQINASRTNANSQNGSVDGVNQTNYNFVQNNYSPKALSRTEIYRQTNNQFSRIKGATRR